MNPPSAARMSPDQKSVERLRIYFLFFFAFFAARFFAAGLR